MARSTRLQTILRWTTIGVTGFLGAYLYSQLHAGYPVWTDAARFGVFPVARLGSDWLLQRTGLAQWACTLRPELISA